MNERDQEAAQAHIAEAEAGFPSLKTQQLNPADAVIQAIHARECGCEWGAGNHEQEERRSWRVFARDVLVNLDVHGHGVEQRWLRDEFERLNGEGSSMEPL